MNKVVKRILRYLYYFPSTFCNKINYFFKKVTVGKGHETKGLLCIKNNGKIHIGNNVRINSSGKANPIGFGDKTYFQVFKNGEIIIADNVRMSNCAITSQTAVKIGEYARIGAGVKIYDTDFHSIDPYLRTSVPEGKPVSKPVEIGEYAFIGAGSIILKGVSIGKYSVIGAGSVVTKNVPDGEIWGGNPAKRIGIINSD
ncbi:MAG: acyltransferase [Clostridia bacterium]|nr:acyltransferase [Clostridia bacterium]